MKLTAEWCEDKARRLNAIADDTERLSASEMTRREAKCFTLAARALRLEAECERQIKSFNATPATESTRAREVEVGIWKRALSILRGEVSP